MWIIRIGLILSAFVWLTGCGPVLVEISTLPASPGVANIKQVSGEIKSTNSHTCNLPCPLTVERDNNYVVGLDMPGYYPVVVQLDWLMAYNTSSVLGTGETSDGDSRVPLVIPLVPRKLVAPHQYGKTWNR